MALLAEREKIYAMHRLWATEVNTHKERGRVLKSPNEMVGKARGFHVRYRTSTGE